jgi:hypothetical protein
MYYRTWNNDATVQTKQEFKLHLKPSEKDNDEGVSRIYFNWDDSKKQIIIGMITQHPANCKTLQNFQSNGNRGKCQYTRNIVKNTDGTPYCAHFIDSYTGAKALQN